MILDNQKIIGNRESNELNQDYYTMDFMKKNKPGKNSGSLNSMTNKEVKIVKFKIEQEKHFSSQWSVINKLISDCQSLTISIQKMGSVD